jgi:hypothetical protein
MAGFKPKLYQIYEKVKQKQLMEKSEENGEEEFI